MSSKSILALSGAVLLARTASAEDVLISSDGSQERPFCSWYNS